MPAEPLTETNPLAITSTSSRSGEANLELNPDFCAHLLRIGHEDICPIGIVGTQRKRVRNNRKAGRSYFDQFTGTPIGQLNQEHVEHLQGNLKGLLGGGARRESAKCGQGSPWGRRYCRRLAKDWECLNRNALAFLRWASIRLMLRKLCRLML